MSIILSDGEFPQNPIPLQLLREADTVYCCDGAIRKLARWLGDGNALKSKEIFVVGDGDSLSSPEWERLQQQQGGYTLIRHKESEQDYNDLTKAFRFARQRGEKELTFIGATGLREDHTLGNISLMVYYLQQGNGMKISMVTDYGIFTPITQTTTFASFPRQQVSIFCMDGCRLTSQGLQYPLDNRALGQWWEGTLNAALGDAFTLSIPPSTSAQVLVYQTHLPKE